MEQAKTTKVVFDNTRIHLTAGMEKLWAYLRLEINTLLAYTPHLVPVKAVFCVSLNQISNQIRGKSVNYGMTSGKNRSNGFFKKNIKF